MNIRKNEPSNLAKRDLEGTVRPFVEKSLSGETRRAYGRVIKEFFTFHRYKRPEEIIPADVIRFRDALIEQKKASSTVAFKLSVIRSLFEYLRVGGFVQNNPALTKLVAAPKPSEDLRGRALALRKSATSYPTGSEKAGRSARLCHSCDSASNKFKSCRIMQFAGFFDQMEQWKICSEIQGQRRKRKNDSAAEGCEKSD